jgi:hypothetical protein
MADHTDNGLRAAIKALTDVVAPALDAGNPVAREQLKLVVQFLEFHRERLPHALDRDRFELRQHLALAERLFELAPAEGLGTAIVHGRELDDAAWVRAADARRVTAALETACSAAVRRAAELEPSVRRPIERAVVDAAGGFLDGERAWFAPQGFEPDPAALPTLEDALGTTR